MKFAIICFSLLALQLFAKEEEGLKWYKGNTHTHTKVCGHADSTPEFVTA